MKFYLGLGSNDGDRELHLRNALNYLAEICDNIYSSTHYASPSDHSGEEHYLNSVALVEFGGTPHQLDEYLKKFELSEGRDDRARAEGKVPLDIDIVIAEDKILRPKDFSCYFFRRGYEELQ